MLKLATCCLLAMPKLPEPLILLHTSLVKLNRLYKNEKRDRVDPTPLLVFGSSFIQSSSPHSHLLLPLLLACLPAAHLSSPVQEGQIALHLPWHCIASPLYPLCLVAERIVWVMTAVRSGGVGEDIGTEILKGDDGERKGWRKCSTWCSLSSTTSSSCFGTWTLLFPFPVIAVKWSSCCAL